MCANGLGGDRMMKKRFPWGMLLPVLVLLADVALLLLVLASDARSEQEKAYTKAEMNAVSYSGRLQENLHQALDVTQTMKQIVISRDGDTEWFPEIAENLMSDALQSIQLAPGGVVTDIYPEAGNEAGKIWKLLPPSTLAASIRSLGRPR